MDFGCGHSLFSRSSVTTGGSGLSLEDEERAECCSRSGSGADDGLAEANARFCGGFFLSQMLAQNYKVSVV